MRATRLAFFLAVGSCGLLFAQAAAAGQEPIKEPSALLQLHRSLVEIPSITGSEHDISAFLRQYLGADNFTIELQGVENGRQNVFAYLGQSRETRVLITSHIDTVPPFIPYSQNGGVIYGRGSNDAKGSVASQISAFQALRDKKAIDEGDVALLFVVGEERGGAGMKAANKLNLTWETVIFGEPTELKLASGHKGGLGFSLVAKGKAGHSGYPKMGRSAIDILARGLVALQTVQLPNSKKYGKSTLNVGQVEGGVAANVIPENASATVSVRVAVDDISSIKRVIEDAVSDVSPWLEIVWSPYSRGPVAIDHDVAGFEEAVMKYGTDIPNLEGTHKRYLYGPGSILTAHSDHEYVRASDLFEAVEGYQILIKHALECRE